MTWLGTFALIGNFAPGYYLTAVCVFRLGVLITIQVTAADKTFTPAPTKV